MAVAVSVLAACGGSSGAERLVAGNGYTFDAPGSWHIERSARQVEAVQGDAGVGLVAVSRFALLRTFRPQLWTKVVHELDAAASAIAKQQHGRVTAARDVALSRQRARRYKLAYDLRGKKLVEELGFVLRGKTEYLLLCRYGDGASHKPCDSFMASFTLT